MRVFFVPVFLLLSSIFILMAAESSNPAGVSIPNTGEDRAVHIVYVNRPEGEDPEDFHIRTLASVVGSEEAAKDALIYHYKHAASGFSAKLTSQQVSELSQKPEVLQVMPSRNMQLHSTAAGAGTATVHRPGTL